MIANNTALHNSFCGILVSAAANATTLDQNQSRYNEEGICLGGSGHAVSLNVVSGSHSRGISVTATDSVFDRNSSKGNGSKTNPVFGIVDFTHGGGTSGTANTYTSNICTGNQAGFESGRAVRVNAVSA